MSKLIYMDNAATTKVDPKVLETMLPYFSEDYYNASSAYRPAGQAANKVDEARGLIADFIGADPGEIYFTAGGSESDNWAIKGVADALKKKGNHIITTQIEHHAVLHTCEYLEKQGFEVVRISPDENGKMRCFICKVPKE